MFRQVNLTQFSAPRHRKHAKRRHTASNTFNKKNILNLNIYYWLYVCCEQLRTLRPHNISHLDTFDGTLTSDIFYFLLALNVYLSFSLIHLCDFVTKISRTKCENVIFPFPHSARFRVRKYLHIWFRFMENWHLNTTDTTTIKANGACNVCHCCGSAIMRKLASERNRLVVTTKESKE